MAVAIEYINKEIRNINSDGIVATEILYEITENDMVKVAATQSEEYTINRFFLYKNWGEFEMVVDNIEAGLVIQGGIVGDKFILSSFIVKQGLEKLLLLLAPNL